MAWMPEKDLSLATKIMRRFGTPYGGEAENIRERNWNEKMRKTR